MKARAPHTSTRAPHTLVIPLITPRRLAPQVIDRRLAAYHAEKDKILAAYEDAGIPIAIVDNARSELETFREVAEFVEVVRLRKQELASMAEFEGAAGPDPFEDDVAELCDIDDMACLEEYDKFARKGGAAALLDAVRRYGSGRERARALQPHGRYVECGSA